MDINVQMTQAVQTAFASIRGNSDRLDPAGDGDAGRYADDRADATGPGVRLYIRACLIDLRTPHTYIQDNCEYLKNKWASTNSPPGTVVMVIMFHAISKGLATGAKEISNQDFEKLMNDLHDAGFQAIYMQELQDFLYTNAKIPQRSVLLIQDDRHAAENFTDHFLPYYQQWGWPVINGWISTPLNTADLWQQQVDSWRSRAGWIIEAHGVQHLPIDNSSSDAYILGELQGSIDAFQEHFNKTPIAFIWPGGGFTPHAVAIGPKYRL